MSAADKNAFTSAAEGLLAWPATDVDAIAVRMLVEEHEILDRPEFQHVTVVQGEAGVRADWVNLSLRLDKLVRDEEERQFLEIVLAIALGRQIFLDCVLRLDERRLAIVLRALVTWAGVDSIAVGTRS
ncbi:hypothetical protein [Streptomyces aureocirculatus]|uniref:hypothetical protein n=1 Tax=Streptomyces aureocirculatus TaxID=67275 RepID=UPI0004CBE621|nr:hypothetical protein [Streptomyces aureocirculatus]